MNHPPTLTPLQRRAALLFATVFATLVARGQVAPAPSAATASPAKKDAPIELKSDAASTEGDSTVTLTPFEVNEAASHGYQATATMSGTRLNSNLEDLAASLSVVTKEQLLDTASTDINDVFKYEVNTEGTSQFTNYSVDRGTVTDGVSSNPQGSTRMRGLTPANTAINGFTSSLPFDTYNIDAVEISRGPNSTVFGLSNTGGGVNIVSSKANTSRETTSFTTRGDSYGGYRGSFDLNRPIFRDRLAVRVMGLYEEKGYERKPSQDTTRRFEVAATARPIKSMTVNASFESYRNFNNRPNAITPRDTYTDWVKDGKPTWDPITSTVHFGNGAAPIVGVTTAQEATLLPYALNTSDSAFQGSPSMYVEGNGKISAFTINRLPSSTGLGPNNIAGTARLLQDSNYYVRNSAANPLFNAPEISNKSLYDWTSVNLVAPNTATTRGETSNVEINQSLLSTPRQTLAAQGAWYYERIGTYDHRFLGTGGASLEPYIDINERNLDGTPNPYFLRPYIGGAAPSTSIGYKNTEDYRGTLAYDLNLSHEKNILRWLGRNRFTGYGEYRAVHSESLGFQDVMTSNNSWMGTVANRKSASFMSYPRYYVGDANGQNVDYAPAAGLTAPYTLPLYYLNGVTNKWTTEDVTYGQFYDANRPNKSQLSTYGGVWQGFYWGDRIIPLFGARRDYYRTRDSDSAINPTAATNGFYDLSPLDHYTVNDWVKNRGTTTNYGIVVKPLSWLHLSYSQSDAFSPGSQTYDVYGHPLPDPKGDTKDYGFQLNLFKNKLIIVAKQYETVDIGRSTSDLNTIVQRAVRMDYQSSSGDPGLGTWYAKQLATLHPDWSVDQLNAETLKQTGVDTDYIRTHINKTHGDASNSYSRGKEFEVSYNPNQYWTLKFTGSDSNPLNGTLSPAVQAYIDSRMPTWMTVKDPVNPTVDWWTHPESGNNTVPRDFYTVNVLAPLKLAVALQGKRRTQTREYHASFVTNYRLAGITDNRFLKNVNVGGSVRWEDKAAIGYYAAGPDSDGIVRLYDPTRPIWDKGHYYTDINVGYNLRLFGDKIRARLQLNVNNIFEDGRLQPIAANPDGSPWAFRIIDPRQFIFQARFDL